MPRYFNMPGGDDPGPILETHAFQFNELEAKVFISYFDWVGVAVYYDRECKNIDEKKFFQLFSDKNYQQVKVDRGIVHAVSTIWLGIDHGHGAGKGPVIFETMVFDKMGAEVTCIRACTENVALLNHEQMCKQYVYEKNRFSQLEVE